MKRYEDDLLEKLREPVEAAAYLDAVLETEDPAAFLVALRQVTQAHPGGVRKVAERTDLGRESLYKALSPTGNPGLWTLDKVLHAVGLRLSISPATDERMKVNPK
jgi:probable addiction module antidote protein